MKLKNKLISTFAAVSAASLVAPIVTSCSSNSALPTPGKAATYDDAHNWVKNYTKITKSGSRVIRDSLAKSADIYLSTEKLNIDGTGFSVSYQKAKGQDFWIPVTKTVPISYGINSLLDFGIVLKNHRAAFSAVDILTLDNKSITAEQPTYDRICDFIFNPFLLLSTFEDIHKLTTYSPSYFKEIFTSTEDRMYITYEISDLAKLLDTKEIKDLLNSDTACFIPFRGEGKVRISIGVDSEGYMCYAQLYADSDYLEIYTSPTSGKYPLRPTFFGSVHGTVNYEAYLKNFNIPRVNVSVDGTLLDWPQDRDIIDPETGKRATPTKPQWVNPEEWEFVEGLEYYVSFKNQSYKILPGYGATVVVEAPQAWNVKDFTFKIGKQTYTYDDIGPNGSGEIVATEYYNDGEDSAHTYIFYLKAPTFDLCDGNSPFEILLKTK